MNFLAHFHLAWPDGGLIAGGLEGDYYKGPMGGDLDPAIAQGVRLHRTIDAYTDSHPVLMELRRCFPPHLRRYAGILIDISFDHYLTRHWSRYNDMSLEKFNQCIYQVLTEQQSLLSASSQRMVKRLIDYDILNRYHNWEAVPGTAARVGERFRRGNPLQDVNKDIEPLRKKLEVAFLNFYPDIQEHCETTKRNYVINPVT